MREADRPAMSQVGFHDQNIERRISRKYGVASLPSQSYECHDIDWNWFRRDPRNDKIGRPTARSMIGSEDIMAQLGQKLFYM
jgi:hypothetical protein